MRLALVIAFLALSCSCKERPQRAQGPQPYLIFSVLCPNKIWLRGTLGSDVPFDYSSESKDGGSSLSMHASLIEKSPSGFRFLWRVAQRSEGQETSNISREEFAPWGEEKKLSSVPGYSVSVFYAPTPADEFTR
jgi:hypothetical protein